MPHCNFKLLAWATVDREHISLKMLNYPVLSVAFTLEPIMFLLTHKTLYKQDIQRDSHIPRGGEKCVSDVFFFFFMCVWHLMNRTCKVCSVQVLLLLPLYLCNNWNVMPPWALTELGLCENFCQHATFGHFDRYGTEVPVWSHSVTQTEECYKGPFNVANQMC